MGRTTGIWFGGAALVIIGLVVGVMITVNCDLTPASNAQEETSIGVVPGAGAAAGSPFVAVADAVLPAVVSVDTKRTVRRAGDPFGDMFREFFGEEWYRRRFGDEGEERYREYEIPGSASGFIYDSRGYVMTNNHVVDGADEIEVTLSDGRQFAAEIVGQDPSTDIAVIQIEGRALPMVNLGDSDLIDVGDWAIAVGNPLELEGTVTVGVISAKGRTDLNIRGGAPLYQDFIQTDASINFGNSGGPLVNIDGEVVGVNTAINAAANGIGFAIPINLARNVAESLVTEGKVVRGYLGVVPQEITPELAEARDLPGTGGIMIANVQEDTPADEAGLEAGDVVVEFGGIEITDVPQFRRVVAGFQPDEPVEIIVLRDGDRKSLEARLAERPDAVAAAEEQEEPEREVWFGIHVVDLNDPLARELQTEAEEGVLVVDLEAGEPGVDSGLQIGDVIVKIANQRISDLSDYRETMRRLEGQDKAIAVMVQRGAYTYFVAIKPE
ncbi:MAG: Do family serine endopeptidase [Candidatus Eisenbacteria bacterium]|nr:Do family serine endopeptidase [Candidatus Eisenbacteria bacterium]